MYRVVTIAALALALSACSGNAPLPEPGETASAAPASDALPVMGPQRNILAVGDSLFAGYGLASPAEAYPARLEAALRARGVNAKITNAGVSGDTSGAGAERFAFVLKSQPQKPDLVIIEFGGNDVLRGVPPAQTRANLIRMLDAAKAAKVPVLLMGMLAPPNLGPAF
jgi:acyl-CoA thioesterase-1